MATGDLIPNTPIQSEPLQKHRWILRFPSKIGLHEFQLSSAARPNWTVDEVKIPFLNQEQYVAGKYKFETMSVSLVDYIGPSTTQAAIEWIRTCAEETTGRMGYAAGYMNDLELEILDPTGVCVQKWILKDAFITQYKGGSLDYESGGLLKVELTLRYSRAVLLF